MLCQPEQPDGLQQPQRPDGIGIGRILGGLEAHLHVALCAQVVHLIGPNLLHNADQVGRVGQVAIVQDEVAVVVVRILVQVVYALRVERRRSAFDAVHLVSFFQQQLG